MHLYSSIVESKSSLPIPLFSSGKSMESRYDPLNEAEKKLNNQQINSKIVLIFGIGSGIYLKLLAEKYKEVFFIAIENSNEDIVFLSQLETFKNLYSIKNVQICSLEELENTMLQYYIPAFYGNLQIIEQRAWIVEQQENYQTIKLSLNNILKKISSDFSVQSHFGKLWQRNFISNLISNTNYHTTFKKNIDTSKEAVIVAAGPSLDKTISLLKQKNKYFIISTDTAFQTLIKQKIIPDIVISIDGQNISYTHYLYNTNKLDTVFVFDLCGNSKAVYKLQKSKNNIFFINTGHPLINNLSEKNINSIPYISAGSGTVTIAGFNLAIKLGFKKIKILGADFSYLDGKTYTKGTYLDSLYLSCSNKLNSFEKKFNHLQFRTQLIKISKNSYTTEILNSYKQSFENLIKDYNCKIDKTNNIYEIQINEITKKSIDFCKQNIDSNYFFNNITKEYDSLLSEINIQDIKSHNLQGLLPYIANLRMSPKNSSKSISELVKLAYKNIVRYNY